MITYWNKWWFVHGFTNLKIVYYFQFPHRQWAKKLDPNTSFPKFHSTGNPLYIQKIKKIKKVKEFSQDLVPNKPCILFSLILASLAQIRIFTWNFHLFLSCSSLCDFLIIQNVFSNYCNFLFHDSGADLSDTDLRGADFSLANVTKVILIITFIYVLIYMKHVQSFCFAINMLNQ